MRNINYEMAKKKQHKISNNLNKRRKKRLKKKNN